MGQDFEMEDFETEYEDLGSVTLTLEDDTELECDILCIFPVEDQQYIALLPLDENGEAAEDAEILLFRYSEDENGEPGLENIEDDDEYEAAADAFDELLDDSLFDFDDEEDEEEDEE